MDHAINALTPFYDVELDILAEELASKKYAKLSECPSYKSAKALRDAIQVLKRSYYGKAETITIKDEMQWRGLL